MLAIEFKILILFELFQKNIVFFSRQCFVVFCVFVFTKDKKKNMDQNFVERACSLRGYALYCLAMFCFANFLDQGDKWALPTLQSSGLQCASCGSPGDPHYDKCREDCLFITDFEMGLLVGPAYSFTTLVLSFPMGWLADRYNRILLLTTAVIIWSCAIILSAFTTEFWQLLALRVMLGVGQCAVYPCALSMISDLFFENRSLYMACFTCMIYVGQVFGFSAGAISYATSWRISFICLGVPALFFSIPLFFTVREPERGESEKGKVGRGEKTKGGERYGKLDVEMKEFGVEEGEEGEGEWKEEEEGEGEGEGELGEEDVGEEGGEGIREILSTPTSSSTTLWEKIQTGLEDVKEVATYFPFFLVCFASLFKYIAAYSAAGWGQVYFKRVHHIQVEGDVLLLMMLIPIVGALSSSGGSYLGDHFAGRFFLSLQSGKLFFCGIMSCISTIFGILVLLSSSPGEAFGMALLCLLTGEMWFPLCASTCLDITRPNQRSIATSVFLSAACVGSVGTLLVGWLNIVFGDVVDGYSVGENEADIPYDPTRSLMVVFPGCTVIASVLFFVCSYFLHTHHEQTVLRVGG